ncbi:hypothetical protein LTR70_009490 [Exophiala xenobiotica]|uniref:Uncharacterized protein n=1 Tax=Lithohypha guttulata TaxID=1690604 RepID=A0ABR0JX59_9EURO|nr:hypothetical protein LTR24_009386 [Lithohypha guttulata]KAK5310422.1 hypothetical protein LTR70_009490 [Exophiala xenobiotica]
MAETISARTQKPDIKRMLKLDEPDWWNFTHYGRQVNLVMCDKSTLWGDMNQEWRAISSNDHKVAIGLMKTSIANGGSNRLQALVKEPHPLIESAISNRLYQARRGQQGSAKKKRKPPSANAEEQSESAADDNEDNDTQAASDSGDRRNIMEIGSVLM